MKERDTFGVIGTALFASLCLSREAFAQGCVSCYTTAAAGGSQTVHALRSGILLLVFPPVLIFGGILLTVQRWKRRQVPPAVADGGGTDG